MTMREMTDTGLPGALGRGLAASAARVVGALTETHYAHTIHIEAAAGIFDVDCSGFVSYLLRQVARRHYEMVAESTADPRPLARDYYVFAAALAPSIQHGWRRILRLSDTMPGDIVAWKLADSSTGDTGHVFAVANAPVTLGDGRYLIPVYDSSSRKHFNDSRGGGPGQFADGVGSGAIGFRTDPAGAPTAFQFNAGAHVHQAPIAIARIEPFSAG